MVPTKPNKHDLRTKETRELLLRAAETIFVRDGYEGTELGEVATLAGRTKGAIYAHFKSKEEVFLALVEQKAQQYRVQMWAMLAASETIEQNVAAFRRFYLTLAEDQTWALLLLEFKLFAIRHPDSKERLRKLFDEISGEDHEKRLAHLLGPAGRGKDTLSRAMVVQVMQPILSGLAIEARFVPDVLDERAVRKIAGRVFDALLR
ncbi:TetR/AcrR family transcriptional regulator [uncultured Paludibaculum sp.]|uniref:TetR/AcrR family transcriptional regulator n=1 Tax=uncultured Paludibaculum sp. TaxID=1765020 RepID=UPI002AABB674|nr:TetR/AcrR family transcriptional regulator [uncultured Paludibaculum sp.]